MQGQPQNMKSQAPSTLTQEPKHTRPANCCCLFLLRQNKAAITSSRTPRCPLPLSPSHPPTPFILDPASPGTPRRTVVPVPICAVSASPPPSCRQTQCFTLPSRPASQQQTDARVARQPA